MSIPVENTGCVDQKCGLESQSRPNGARVRVIWRRRAIVGG